MVYPGFDGGNMTVRRRQLQMTRWVNLVVYTVGQLLPVSSQLLSLHCAS